jgi:hypothetical protein
MAGLLDFLRPAQSTQVGDYSMPRMGSAAAYGDGSSPDGFMGRLSSGLQSIGNGDGSLIGAIGGAFGFGGQPAQASPVQIGDYSMPRVGAASAYQPSRPSAPANEPSTMAAPMPAPAAASAPPIQFYKPNPVDLSGLQNAMATHARAPSRGRSHA